MSSQVFKPGDRTPADGLYRVTHYQHRMPHMVSIRGDVVLPVCRKCAEKVCFEYLGASKNGTGSLRADLDFTRGTGQGKS